MPIDRDTVLGTPKLPAGLGLDPSLAESAGAEWRLGNMVGSALASESLWARTQGDFYDIDRNYNVFDDIAGYEDHMDRFEGAFNAKAAAAIKSDIDREIKDRRISDASGWVGTVLGFGASLIDLPTLLPGGVLARTGGKIGYSAAKSALSVGAAAGVSAAVQEAGLQATQQTRTAEESAWTIGGSVVLGALLGAGAGAFMSRSEYKAASKLMEDAARPDFDAATDALHAELSIMAKPESAGAAAAPAVTLDDFGVAGKAASKAAKATARLNPLLRTLHSPSVAVREIASQLMENPVYLKRNLEGQGEAAAETSMKEWTRGAVGSTVEDMNEAYQAMRKRGVAMTRTEFNNAVGQAMRRGDRSDIPEVAQAAASIRAKVFDPLKDRAVAAGLLPEGVSVDTAESYFSRVWNRPVIEANEAEFKQILRNYFDGQVTAAAQRAAAETDKATASLRSAREAIERGMAGRQADASALSDGVARGVADVMSDDAMRAFRSGVDTLAGRVVGELDEADLAKLAKIDAEMEALGRRGEYDWLSDADRKNYLDEIVDSVYEVVTGRALDADLPSNIIPTKRGPLAERTFHIPDELVEKFLDSNADLIMRRYARVMAADVELKTRFGSVTMKDQIKTIRDQYAQIRAELEKNTELPETAKQKQLAKLAAKEKSDIEDIQAVRDMLRGTYNARSQTTAFGRIANAAMTFNYLRTLGGVTISSLTDAVRPAMVHGLKSYMEDGLKPLIRNMQGIKLAKKEAKEAGAISEKILHSRLATLADLTDPYAQGSPFERFLQNASVGFTKMTGLLHWNDFQKTLAATMTQNRILKNAEIAADRGFDALPKAEQAYMAYLGLGRDGAPLLGRLFREHGQVIDGVRVANSEVWPAEMDHMVRSWRAAINKDVDSIIVTKGVADVPLFASTTVGRMLLQFRSFALASNQRVLLRGLQEKQTRFWGGVIAMSAIGSFIYMLKQLESGREISDNPGTWIAEGLDRSGIFSLAFEVSNAMEKLGGPGIYRTAAAAFPSKSQKAPASRFASRSVVGSYAGPSFEMLTDLGSAVGMGFRALDGDLDMTAGDVGTLRRLTPFVSLPYFRWLIDGQIVNPLKEDLQR
ncbi:hypothetical protein ACDP63_11160 [Paracoccus sp. P2]|uniref:OmpH family outer membrane protein n=1 Tax=Paracoccus sp. P2 TaxID=3248840 RepID=UPI00391EF63C